MKKNIFHTLLFLLAFGLATGNIAAQKGEYTFEIEKIEADKNTFTIDILARIMQNQLPVRALLDKSLFQVQESVQGMAGADLDLLRVETAFDTIIDHSVKDTFQILFLVDVGEKGDEKYLKEVKKQIAAIVSSMPLSSTSSYQLLPFDSKARTEIEIGADNLDSQLKKLRISSKGTDLYGVLFNQIRTFKTLPGKKILFLFSKGTTEREKDLAASDYNANDVLNRQVKKLESNFFLFPIGFGDPAEHGFLKKLAAASPNTKDQYRFRELPVNINHIIKSNVIVQSTHRIKAFPKQFIFQGNQRTYTVVFQDGNPKNALQAATDFQLGTPSHPEVLKPEEQITWQLAASWGFLGILLVVLVFMACYFGWPFYQQQLFKNKHVHPYEPKSGIRHMNIISLEPIKKGELVVHACSQITPLEVYEGVGNQCPCYPDCLNYDSTCNGGGKPLPDFDSLEGVYRYLNWMWFGMVGGFLAWCLMAVFKLLNFEWFTQWTANISNEISSASAMALANDTLIGAAFGTGLVLMLAYVEERTQSRKISIARILKRTFAGLVVAILIFFVGYHLQYSLKLPAYVSGQITWLAMSLAIGALLSYQSSVSLSRGLLGGAIASIVAYNIYAIIPFLIEDFIFAKLISLMILGAVLGLILVTIITALETFELEIVEPKAYQSHVPVSKWLEQKLDVFIGTDVGCYVYVRWQDKIVAPKHAKLTYDGEQVYIVPLAETYINGNRIKDKYLLKDKDVIQPGRFSKTKFRYREKRKEKETPRVEKQQAAMKRKDEKGKKMMMTDK